MPVKVAIGCRLVRSKVFGLPELLIIVAIALVVFGPNSGRLKTKLSTLILTGAVGAGAFLVKPPKVRELGQAIVIARARFGDLLSLRHANDVLQRRTRGLQGALTKIKTLRGLIPICAYCKKIRSDKRYWQPLEVYLTEHTEAGFTHGICPECLKQTEMQVNTIVDSKEPGVLPAEEKASCPPGDHTSVERTSGLPDGKKKK